MSKVHRLYRRKARGIRITRLMARDGECCMLCGLPLDRHIPDVLNPEYITFDHIVPESDGGTDDLNNLQLAHRLCNQLRGAEPLTALLAVS